MTSEPQLDQHNVEIAQNRRYWESKPLLQALYREFYVSIAKALKTEDGRDVLELGSGIGAIKTVLPRCQTSDIFPNPWLDRVESAYSIRAESSSLSGLVLFDVWHHLEYPAAALNEFARVLKPAGRLVIFDPAMGMLGRLIYGLFHHEPVAMSRSIDWTMPVGAPPLRYYAAQGNCWRMFIKGERPAGVFSDFRIDDVRVFSALSYVASGGFSKPQLFPTRALPAVRSIERVLDKAPRAFGTRMMVTLERL
jgi:SAM-dependent methyltransferase